MSCSARLPVYLLLISAFLSPRYSSWVCSLTLFALYCIGLVSAPIMAFLLKSTLLRGETPAFVMEMPLYKMPSLHLIIRRALEAGWMFVWRAGTLILASMIVIWALLYFPATDAQNSSQSMQQSLLGQVGKFIEPAVKPLGWDWKIGTAALASFPAREVMVGALGIIYGQGKVDSDEILTQGLSGGVSGLGLRMRQEETFTIPVTLSVLVFFALCCQCVSTLAVIRRESNSWTWPAFTFVYMTVLAYVGALVVYQVSRLLI